MSILIAFYPLLSNQESNFDANNKIWWHLEPKSPPQVKSCRFTPWWKNNAGRVEDLWVWKSKYVKTNTTFWHFWSIMIPLHGRKSMIAKAVFWHKYKALFSDHRVEIRSVVLEKHEFENHGKSVLGTFLAFWTIKIALQERNSHFFEAQLSPKVDIFIATLVYLWRNMRLNEEVYQCY